MVMAYEIAPEELKSLQEKSDRLWYWETCANYGRLKLPNWKAANTIPMGDIPARFNQELDPEDHIVVVCHHGVRSMNVTA